MNDKLEEFKLPNCKCPKGRCLPEQNEGTFCWRSGFFIPTGEFQDEESSPQEPDGECFRGREAAAFEAEEMARIQRELK